MSGTTLKLQKIREGATLPAYQTPGAAGFDLCAAEDVVVPPRGTAIVPTGWAIEIPEGYEVQIRPRSGVALKRPILIPNSPGTIDSDYRGEVGVIVRNVGCFHERIAQGDRIAQAVLSQVPRAEIVEVEELSDTERGVGGFGSTGR